jgi:hypothetical protein
MRPSPEKANDLRCIYGAPTTEERQKPRPETSEPRHKSKFYDVDITIRG